MVCPSCRKKVVFGSVVGDAWRRISTGEWLHGHRAPNPGRLGDCPECGVRLDWEPGEQAVLDPDTPPVARVHLAALREEPQAWHGQRIWLRSLLVVEGEVGFLSDSWRTRPKGGVPEDDAALFSRLRQEQHPRIDVFFEAPEVRAHFDESARRYGGVAAAWLELEGLFRLAPPIRRINLDAIRSIWPPTD